MTGGVLPALHLTLLVASLATVVTMLVGCPLGYLLARWHFPGKRALSALLLLPMVLPPTAVGYLLLRLFADRGWLGANTLGFDPQVLFTWRAAVVAASVMSLPVVLRTARVAFEGVDPRLEAMARTLGLGPWRTFFTITLPLARNGLVAAAILGLLRALGEFGATVMIAGNIPGRTQTLALAIYGAQQAGHPREAMVLIALAVVVGFAALVVADALIDPVRKERR